MTEATADRAPSEAVPAAELDAHLEAHRVELTGYCYRILGSAFEAEDAVQETFIRAWRGYDRFEGQRAYRQLAELYRAVRLYINFFQPSLKLRTKRRSGAHVSRTYHPRRRPSSGCCPAVCSAPQHASSWKASTRH